MRILSDFSYSSSRAVFIGHFWCVQRETHDRHSTSRRRRTNVVKSKTQKIGARKHNATSRNTIGILPQATSKSSKTPRNGGGAQHHERQSISSDSGVLSDESPLDSPLEAIRSPLQQLLPQPTVPPPSLCATFASNAAAAAAVAAAAAATPTFDATQILAAMTLAKENATAVAAPPPLPLFAAQLGGFAPPPPPQLLRAAATDEQLAPLNAVASASAATATAPSTPLDVVESPLARLQLFQYLQQQARASTFGDL